MMALRLKKQRRFAEKGPELPSALNKVGAMSLRQGMGRRWER
jgi:hypothetical protein